MKQRLFTSSLLLLLIIFQFVLPPVKAQNQAASVDKNADVGGQFDRLVATVCINFV